MTTVQQDFQTRAGEIENYFRFVQLLADGEILLTPSDATVPPLNRDDSDSLLKTLKANGFILLYNLVESTMKRGCKLGSVKGFSLGLRAPPGAAE